MLIKSQHIEASERKKMPREDNPNTYEIETIRPKSGTWKTYDATDGLPAGVSCMLQDRVDYLWLGTQAGLCRYDGAEFITYTTRDGLANFTKTFIVS